MSAPARLLTRRRALAGASAAIVGVASGCSAKYTPSNVPLSRHTTGVHADLEVLDHLLDRERYAIAAYSAAIPMLGRGAARAATQFLAHELAHASELEGLIKQAGGKPGIPPAFYDLGSPRSERQLLELLHRVEGAQIEAYLSSLRVLQPPRLRAAAAAILANEAQHVAVVRGELGRDPLPAAVLTAGE